MSAARTPQLEAMERHLGQYFTEDLHVVWEVSCGLEVLNLEVAAQRLYDVARHVHRVRLYSHLSQQHLDIRHSCMKHLVHYMCRALKLTLREGPAMYTSYS